MTITASRGFVVNLEQLETAVQRLRAVADADRAAAHQAKQARVGHPSDYGKSSQARSLTHSWNAAGHRRAHEFTVLAKATDELADALHTTIENYRRVEHENTKAFTPDQVIKLYQDIMFAKQVIEDIYKALRLFGE